MPNGHKLPLEYREPAFRMEAASGSGLLFPQARRLGTAPSTFAGAGRHASEECATASSARW
jgi:hypothetical protein